MNRTKFLSANKCKRSTAADAFINVQWGKTRKGKVDSSGGSLKNNFKEETSSVFSFSSVGWGSLGWGAIPVVAQGLLLAGTQGITCCAGV